jgi:hypothetical protein
VSLKTRVLGDPHGEHQLVLHYREDVGPLLAQNREKFKDEGRGYSPSREWREVADIPEIVYHVWLKEHGVDLFKKDHWPAVKRLLNSPDYRWLRTSPGWI